MVEGRTRLCATVTARTTAGLRAARDAQAGADLVELRLDTLEHPDVAGALQGRRQPVVVTCRAAWEGGAFAGNEAERRRILLEACRLGAEYVDVEQRADFAGDLLAARDGRGVVLSFHAFDGLPADLEARYRAMRGTGAEVVKIAAAVASLEESLRVATVGSGNEPRVLIGMGAAGVPSRVLAGRFGSCWTYAGDNVAPGQIDLRRMRDQFRAHAVSEATAVYGVLGSPIGHSLSPAMHNAGFRATGVDAVYLPLEAAGVDDFLAFARAVGLQGASVTAPYKEQIAAHVEEQDATSRAVGAVNTLRSRDGGGWEGLNTDVPGLLAPLEECVNLAGARATVIGAGGVARAAAFALRGRGAAVTVCARRPEQAAAVARVARNALGAAASAPRIVGPSGEHHAGRNLARRRAEPAAGWAVRRAHRLRPGLQPVGDPPDGGRGPGGMRDHRRSRHAGGPGDAPVRVVDRRDAVRRSLPAGGRAGPRAPGARISLCRRPAGLVETPPWRR